MSCTRYRIMDPQRDRLHLDFKYPHSCCATTCHTSHTVRNPCSTVCSNRSYSGNHTNWKSSDLSRNNNETFREGRGDPPFPDSKVQMGRNAGAHAYGATRHHESAPVVSIERMQIRLKLLEDSNTTLLLRNRDLVAENKNLAKRVEEDAPKMEKLRENLSLLQNELDKERIKLADVLAKQMKYDEVCLKNKCTSSTNVVSKTDYGLQIWEPCKDCHAELEGCQRESLTRITITKSEFELLERDMRTLRDAVIVREEAWDKAMEREENCRQQLARLTAEVITARHLCESRQDELRAVTDTLTEKESELRMMEKETLNLNKLIAKLHRRQRELEEHASDGVSFGGISERDQRYIEEIARRVRNSKSKSKTKSKCTSDKYPRSNSGSPRENRNGQDQAGSSDDRRKLNF
ncbi:PREDICTED: cingulin-like [Wasmannia auropunctata]|uniref:cingulin-like n=1 Tax=Wasmannia auropunctata TaxID=64793 RepID=UPI0005EFCCB6|nr:PREDICTED: cingulin-like [Wasmannia auropunctata]XP_011704963.1 PREDICTED: cingulin-like [Wasmannia auropunctata]